MNNVNTTAKANVIKIIKEAKYRYETDEFGMMVFLEEKAREYVNRANAFPDTIIKKLNLLIARELVRVRERLLETILGL